MEPAGFAASLTGNCEVSASFTPLFFRKEEEEEAALRRAGISSRVCLVVWEKGSNVYARTFTKEYALGNDCECECECGSDEGKVTMVFREILCPETVYCLKMSVEQGRAKTGWSEEAEVTTPEFKECPEDGDGGDGGRKSAYTVEEERCQVATMVLGGDGGDCAITGCMPLPQGKAVSWRINALAFASNDSDKAFVGVAPCGIVNWDRRRRSSRLFQWGWYFECRSSTLWSGPPHDYGGSKYGPIWLFRKSFRAGSSIGVTMNTALGALSFSVNGKSYGGAYSGILLDKPLVPCVVLKWQGDSVELVI